jgi:hypothetical protein
MTDMFQICGKLETVHVEYSRIKNLVHIYEEQVTELMELLENESTAAVAKYTVARYEALESLLEVIESCLSEANVDFRQMIDTAYQQIRSASPNEMQEAG